MIDWITILAPLPHPHPIAAGHVLCLDAFGAVEWTTTKRVSLQSSWGTALTIRTATHTPERCTHVEISGNPVKWFQGHNLWGTDDLPSLVVATLHQVAKCINLVVLPVTRAAWRAGDIKLTRVDITGSFHLANLGEVLAWVRAAEQTAHLSHRGRGQLVKGSTLYFGKNSRRWSLKLYAKGQEIRAKGHGQESILNLPSAVSWADRTLRAELTIRSLELKRLNLSYVANWLPVDGVPSVVTSKLLPDKLGNMTMTTKSELDGEVLDSLTHAQRHAYLAWVAGNDLRETMSRPSFYRLRSKLLVHGIDIATLLPKEVSNVVPLHRVLEAIPAHVPDWAIGTPLYFEPPRVA